MPGTAGLPPSLVAGRENVRGLALANVMLLAAIIALNLVSIAVGTVTACPGIYDILWLILLAAAGTIFLFWFVPTRKNTATYGPGRMRAYQGWELAGWLCPIAAAWIPYQITAEILRASSIPVSAVSRPAGRPPAATLLRSWWTLWMGMWAALWAFVVVYAMANSRGWGVTTPQVLLDLAFQLLSSAAAACTIAIVLIISRLQAQRAAEPVVLPDRPPPSVPQGVKVVALSLTVLASPFLVASPMLLFIGARDFPGVLLTPAALAPTTAEIAGTWHASDGGVLTFNTDGHFTATGLSLNLADGDPLSKARWTGTGTWQTGGTCDASNVRICLSVNSSQQGIFSEDGFTTGPASSPVLQLPAGDPNSSYTYELRK